jgi:hypothetical protein
MAKEWMWIKITPIFPLLSSMQQKNESLVQPKIQNE